jgi:hypothetical protein
MKTLEILCNYSIFKNVKPAQLSGLIAFDLPMAYVAVVGRDSSVGIATRYGLDGAGIESRWGRDFQHPS